MGTPSFSVPTLEALVDSGYQVVGVYTQPDRPSGRGKGLVESPVKRLALQREIPVYQPTSFKSEGNVAELRSLTPDLIVVAAYGLILPQAVLDTPTHSIINVHPSLLPRHRGASPVTSAILAGDDVTGVTIMLIERRVDAGPMLSRTEVPILPSDTGGSLTDRLARIGADLLVETLPHWLNGEIDPQPQDDSQATNSRMIVKQDGEIDWRLPAIDIHRRIRAFDPWPGTFTRWNGKLLKVLGAIPIDGGNQLLPGKVGLVTDSEGQEEVVVGTGEGALALHRLQLEGRKPLPAETFLRGHQDFPGSLLPS